MPESWAVTSTVGAGTVAAGSDQIDDVVGALTAEDIQIVDGATQVKITPNRIAAEEEVVKFFEEKTYEGTRVTFNFQDIPVRSVLQLIADVSDLNIVVADSVGGNLTLRLTNVPWDQALDIVMDARNLDMRKNGNVLWIGPTAEIAAREPCRIDVMRRFGYFSTESNGHLSEYLPWYRKRPDEVKRWIHPEHWIDGQTAGYLNHCRLMRNEYEEKYPQWLQEASQPVTPEGRSKEHASYIIEALETGRPYRARTIYPFVEPMPWKLVSDQPISVLFEILACGFAGVILGTILDQDDWP